MQTHQTITGAHIRDISLARMGTALSALWSFASASRDCASFPDGAAMLLHYLFLLYGNYLFLLRQNYLFLLYAY